MQIPLSVLYLFPLVRIIDRQIALEQKIQQRDDHPLKRHVILLVTHFSEKALGEVGDDRSALGQINPKQPLDIGYG